MILTYASVTYVIIGLDTVLSPVFGMPLPETVLIYYQMDY